MKKAILSVTTIFLLVFTQAQTTLQTVTTSGNTTSNAVRITGDAGAGSSGAPELMLGVLTTPRTNDTRAFIGWKNDPSTNNTTNGWAGSLLLQPRTSMADMSIDFATGYLTPQLRMRIAGNGNVVIGDNSLAPSGRLVIKGVGSTNSSTSFLVQNSALTELFRVVDDGKVGVGTNTPVEKLNIHNGNLQVTGSGGLNSLIGSVKFSNVNYPNASSGIVGAINANGLDQVDLLFYTAFGTSTEKMRILANSGFVGIGTATPQAKLDVAGNIYCNSKIFIGTADANTATKISGYALAVNGSAIFNRAQVKLYANWPDYVFEEKYNLLPLNKLEQFINDNKHLPEVPSAAEVEKEGIDLGNNQAVLLKKIEELTLYIIDQDKKINKQQEQINQLLLKKSE